MNEERNQTIGQELQEARLEKGLSLDDIQQVTKIQKRYLQAIENGQFDQLPGPFYERAFVRQYANAVGLDADSFIKDHAIETKDVAPDLEKAHVDADNVTRAGMRKEVPSTADRTKSLMPKVLIGAAIILIIGIIWALVASFAGATRSQNDSLSVSVTSSAVSEQKASSSAAKSSEDEAAKKASEEKKAADKDTIKLGPSQVTGNTVKYSGIELPQNKDTDMTLNATADVWTQITDVNGGVLYNGTLKAGANQVIKIPATSKGVTMQIGNANVLKVKLGQEDVKLDNNGTIVWNANLQFKR